MTNQTKHQTKHQAIQEPLATQVMQAPFGQLHLYADDEFLSGVGFQERTELNATAEHNHPILNETVKQLEAYFSGQLKTFDVPLNTQGTDFQKQVWQQLLKIDYGDTQNYGQVANSINNPKAMRAVGNANNKNPIVIIIPCHRVIGAGGTLVGYGGGLPIKQWLLDHEQSSLKPGN